MTAPLSDHMAILVQRLAALRIPQIRGEADSTDMHALADHLVEVADAVDAYVAAVGRFAKSNIPYPVDLAMFERPLFGALQGNATFELRDSAERYDQDNPRAA